MSKRNKLKSIIKECLVEILNEGLVLSENRINERKSNNSKPSLNNITRDHFDNIRKEKTINKQHVESAVNQITTDPILSQVLSETASSSRFQEQLGAEGRTNSRYKPADAASRVMYDADPTEVFENADKWASLAFSSKIK